MSDSDRAAQRQRALARIDHDREQLAATLDELRRPLQTIQRLQKNTRAIVPALLVAGAAFLILRALRGGGKPVLVGRTASHLVVREARRASWFALVMQLVSAYRTARQVGEAVRSASQATAATKSASLNRWENEGGMIATSVPDPDLKAAPLRP